LAWAGLFGLTYLYLSDNQLSDIFAFVELANLTDLYLDGNQISNIYPLVANTVLGEGD
jgi:Leucine-rich repeat (LRR) protein